MTTDNIPEALTSVRLKFTSGNSVSVERAMVTAKEWEAIESALSPRVVTYKDVVRAVTAMKAANADQWNSTGDVTWEHGMRAALESFARYGGTWPEELTSGVMFCRGERITREEFKALAAVKELK